MSYATLAAKTANDSDTISAADLANIDANIVWFRSGRPTFRFYRDFAVAQSITDEATGSWQGLEFNNATAGAQWHEEWMNTNGGTSATLLANAGSWPTGDSNYDEIYVGDEEAGIWIVGGFFELEADSTGIREGRIQRAGSQQLVGRHIVGSANRPAAFHLCAPYDFGSTNDDFVVQTWQNSTVTLSVNESRLPPRFWGLWVGAETDITDNYTSPRATASTTPVAAWNAIRASMLRLQSRPACRLQQATSQSITDSTWTHVQANSVVYENDSAMFTALSYQINIQQAGFYLVTYGAELDTFTNSGAGAQLQLAVDGTRLGNDTEVTASATTAGDTQLSGGQILKLEAGEALSWYVRQNSTVSKTLSGTHLNHLSATLLVGDPDDLSAARQDFSHTGLPDVLHTHADHSADRLEFGYVNSVSDVLDHLWAGGFLYKRKVSVSDGASVGAGKWESVSLPNTVLDPHGFDDDDSTVNPVSAAGGIRVPHAGTYVAVGHCLFDDKDENDDQQGADGERGLRTAVNGQHVTRYLDASGASVGADWGGSVIDIHVCEAGDEIDLELYQNCSDGTDMGLKTASLAVAWVGDGLTRVAG